MTIKMVTTLKCFAYETDRAQTNVPLNNISQPWGKRAWRHVGMAAKSDYCTTHYKSSAMLQLKILQSKLKIETQLPKHCNTSPLLQIFSWSTHDHASMTIAVDNGNELPTWLLVSQSCQKQVQQTLQTTLSRTCTGTVSWNETQEVSYETRQLQV